MDEVDEALGAATLPAIGVTNHSATVLEDAVHVRLRLAQQDGALNPKLSFIDTEFTSVEQYRRYLASREAGGTDTAWSHSLKADKAEGELALKRLIAEQGFEADRGAKMFCERRQLKPVAARRIDELRALRTMLSGSTVLSERKRAKEMQAIDREVARLLESDDSWSNRFLYTMESNGIEDTSGINYMAQVEAATAVSRRQLSDVAKDPLIDVAPSV